jgi:hypothetical protein
MGAPTQLVLVFGGGEHRVFAFGCVVIRDPIDEPSLAPSELSLVVLASLVALASLMLGRDNSRSLETLGRLDKRDLSQLTFSRDLGGFSRSTRFAETVRS